MVLDILCHERIVVSRTLDKEKAMEQKYDHPDKISDEAIREAFASADSVSFSARRFNYIRYRDIAFGDIGWWLPLRRVLPLIGITPQMLRPVFNPQRRIAETKVKVEVKRPFPLNLLEWLGLGKKYQYKTQHEVEEVELPENIGSYEQLGCFVLSDKPFQELASILGKSVKVLREDGGTGEHYHLFTAHPSGEIVEAVKS